MNSIEELNIEIGISDLEQQEELRNRILMQNKLNAHRARIPFAERLAMDMRLK